MEPRIPLPYINTIGILVIAIFGVIHLEEGKKGAESATRKDVVVLPTEEAPLPPEPPKLPPEPKPWKIVRAKVTAYCPCSRCCKPHADGRTATRKSAWKMNGCATYWKAIPKDWMVDIPGIGRKIVDDTGPAMKRSFQRGYYHIDVRMKYHYQARNWGVKWLTVKIYRKGGE